jgi:hypothetical protein
MPILIHKWAIRKDDRSGTLDLYIPNPDCVIESRGITAISGTGNYVIHAPEGSAASRFVAENALEWHLIPWDGAGAP